MPLRYTRDDILKDLKEAGYTTYRLQKQGIISNSTTQKLRLKQPISWDNLERLCRMLDCQPNDIIEYVPDDVTY